MATSLSHLLLVDLVSGTYFSADEAVLLDSRRIPPSELDTFNQGSDSDISFIAAKYGQPLESLI